MAYRFLRSEKRTHYALPFAGVKLPGCEVYQAGTDLYVVADRRFLSTPHIYPLPTPGAAIGVGKGSLEEIPGATRISSYCSFPEVFPVLSKECITLPPKTRHSERQATEQSVAGGAAYNADTVCACLHHLNAAGKFERPQAEAINESPEEHLERRYIEELAKSAHELSDAELEKALNRIPGVYVRSTI